jgi:hypothetical protein
MFNQAAQALGISAVSGAGLLGGSMNFWPLGLSVGAPWALSKGYYSKYNPVGRFPASGWLNKTIAKTPKAGGILGLNFMHEREY